MNKEITLYLKIFLLTIIIISFYASGQNSLSVQNKYDSLRAVYGGNIFGFTPINITYPVLPEDQKIKISKYLESLYVNNIIASGIKGKVILEIICDEKGLPVNITTLLEKPANLNLGKEAINALKLVTFTPALNKNKPASIVFHFKVDFIPPIQDSK